MPETLIPIDSTAARSVHALPQFVCTRSDGDVGVSWIRTSGELDLMVSARLERALHLAQANARLVVLDLRELTFMDSAGLHVIVDAATRARHHGRRLIVVRGPTDVDRVFTLTTTAREVEIVDLHPMAPPAQALLQLARKHSAAA